MAGSSAFAPRAVTEKQFMAQVVRYARLRGCMVFHTHDSRRSEPGFPDLHIITKDDRVLYAELKTLTGKLSEAQAYYISRLKACGECVYVWRPTEESWKSIREALA